jgi:hypothetical protein
MIYYLEFVTMGLKNYSSVKTPLAKINIKINEEVIASNIERGLLELNKNGRNTTELDRISTILFGSDS